MQITVQYIDANKRKVYTHKFKELMDYYKLIDFLKRHKDRYIILKEEWKRKEDK